MVAFKGSFAVLLSLLSCLSQAVTIAEIQGPGFVSPLKGQTVTDVPGIVTVKGPAGFWIRSPSPDKDDRTSESLYVYTGTSAAGKNITASVEIGDSILIDGKVDEYRSDSAHLFLTELIQPKNIRKQSEGVRILPLVLGKDRKPPTEQYTALDDGDILGYPNNRSQISSSGLELQPKKFGLDFWESLSGELVTVRKPVALGVSNQYGDIWVRGDWKVTGKNAKGGLTITADWKGNTDLNPEAILIGSPLDGTKNDDTKVGDEVEEVTGVLTYAFGFYRILPTSKLVVKTPFKGTPPALPPPTKLVSDGSCSLTFGSYNVENMNPKSAHIPRVASHITTYLKTPDIMFLEEIQDSDGTANSGTTSGEATLKALTDSIFSLSGVQYAYVEVAPEDNKDGGAPGANIRNAYLYKPDVLSLVPATAGTYKDAAAILPSGDLNFNPAVIDPSNPAFTSSRKPLVALWETKDKKKRVYTINVHNSSKGGSSSLHGDYRPPINGAFEKRIEQTKAISTFAKSILSHDKSANIIATGDYNEFSITTAFTKELSGVLTNADDVVNLKQEERFTYVFDMNNQMLDHTFVSKRLTERQGVKGLWRRRLEIEHVHLNSVDYYSKRVSDHDPAVGRFNVCY